MTTQAYLGAIGRTRTATMHVSVRRGALVPVPVYTSVDAAAHPELAEQLRDGSLNAVRLGGGELLRIAVPVVYHDPAAGLLVLALCEAHRHRELDERIRVLEQLRDDPAAVPAYAKDFAVVFGGSGLRAYLDRQLHRLRDTDRFEPGPAGEDEVETGAYAAYDARPAVDGDAVPGPLFDIEPAIDGEAAIPGPLFDIEPAIEEQVPALDGAGAGPAIQDPTAGAYLEIEAAPAFDPDLVRDRVIDAEPAGDAEPVSDSGVHAGPAWVPAALDAGAAGDGGMATAAAPEIDPEAAPGAGIYEPPAAAEVDPASDAEPALDAEGSIESEIEIGGAAAIEVGAAAPDDAPAPGDARPGADPPITEITELPVELGGEAGQGGAAPRAPGWHLDDAGVHLGIAADEALARERGDPRAADPVIAAALKMSRGEAVRVLARAVKLGSAAHPALIEGLASSKAYLRHGCALALALGRSDDATQAVIALLLSEPTELWQEIARAIGEVGVPALVWLVRHVGQHGAAAEERIALAMAHVAARGGGPALTTMAAADSIVSPIAAKALELLATVSGDHDGAAPGKGPHAGRDASVNHAFSRQFFEALERDTADDAGAEAAVRDAPSAVVGS